MKFEGLEGLTDETSQLPAFAYGWTLHNGWQE